MDQVPEPGDQGILFPRMDRNRSTTQAEEVLARFEAKPGA